MPTEKGPCKITAEQKAKTAKLTAHVVDVAAEAESQAILAQLAAQSTGVGLGKQHQAPAEHDIAPALPPTPSAVELQASIAAAEQVALEGAAASKMLTSITKLGDITDTDRAALIGYQEVEYGDINEALRAKLSIQAYAEQKHHGGFSQDAVDEATLTLSRMDDFFTHRAVKLPQPVTVYRGLGQAGEPLGTTQEGAYDAWKALEGTMVQDHGFVSTTTNHGVARKFATDFHEPGAVYSISVPAGTPVAWLPVLGTHETAATGYKESELLLNRGNEFMVASVARDDNGRLLIDLTLQPVKKVAVSVKPPVIVAPVKEVVLEAAAAESLMGKSFTQAAVDQGVSSAQRTAVNAYMGSSHRSINQALRDPTGFAEKASAEAQSVTHPRINLIDEYLNGHGVTLASPIRTWRGVFSAGAPFGDKKMPFKDAAAQWKALEGKDLLDKGFISSSTNRDVAVGFSAEGGVLFNFTVPSGVRVGWLGGSEYEVLLDRDTKYTVTKVTELTSKSGHKTLEVDLEVHPAAAHVKSVYTPPLPAGAKPGVFGENNLGVKIGEQQGSNPGGIYKGPDGVTRYVKTYKDPAQAWGEKLANDLYNNLGINAPKSVVVGKSTYASELIPDVKTLADLGITKERADAILKGYAADVLTANWDALGIDHANIGYALQKKYTGGDPIRLDNGAAFLTRAQGARKPESVLNGIGEASTFGTSKNPAYKAIFDAAGTTPAEFQKTTDFHQQVSAILDLESEWGGWGKFVDAKAPGLNVKDRDAIVEMLNYRSDELNNLAAMSTMPVKPAMQSAAVVLDKMAVPALTNTEKFSFIEYQGADYGPINEGLRAKQLKPQYEKTIANIDAVLAKLPTLQEPVVTYRGVARLETLLGVNPKTPLTQQEILAEFKALKGQTFIDNGYMSTTVDRKYVQMFTGDVAPKGDKQASGVEFQITSPIGSRIAWLPKLTGATHEAEALLPRGTTLRIDAVSQLPEGRVVVQATVVKQAEATKPVIALVAVKPATPVVVPLPAPTLVKTVAAPPLGVTKKHDLIAWYRSQGLSDAEVIAKVNSLHGLKIDQAEVNSNAKWYGVPGKIEPNPSVPTHVHGTMASTKTVAPAESAVPPSSAPIIAPPLEVPLTPDVIVLPSPPQPKPQVNFGVPLEGAKAANYLTTHYAPEPVSQADRHAFDRYQSDGNKQINGALRAGLTLPEYMKKAGFDDEEVIKRFEDTNQRMQDIVAATAPLAAPVKVFRSVHDIRHVVAMPGATPGTINYEYGYGTKSTYGSNNPQDVLDAVHALYVPGGKLIQDPAYVSTTTSEAQATKWMKKMIKSKGQSAPGVMYEITLPPGTQAAWAEHFGEKQKNYVVQKELLLPPGQRFQVTEVIAPATKQQDQYDWNTKQTVTKTVWENYDMVEHPFIVKMTLVPQPVTKVALSPTKIEQLVTKHFDAGVGAPKSEADGHDMEAIAAKIKKDTGQDVSLQTIATTVVKHIETTAKGKRAAKQFKEVAPIIQQQTLEGLAPDRIHYGLTVDHTKYEGGKVIVTKPAPAPDITKEQVAQLHKETLATVAGIDKAARAVLLHHPMAGKSSYSPVETEKITASFKTALEEKLGTHITEEKALQARKRVDTITFAGGATTKIQNLQSEVQSGKDAGQIAAALSKPYDKDMKISVEEVNQALEAYGLKSKVKALNETGPQTTAEKVKVLNKTYPKEGLLTHQDRDAIKHYQGPGADINQQLRGDKLSDYYKPTVEKLDAYFAHTPGLPTEFTTYRAVKQVGPLIPKTFMSESKPNDRTVAWFKQLQANGTMMPDKGYTSTSPNRPFVQQWLGWGNHGGVLFNIKLPAGTKAAWIPNAGTGIYKKEQELLLPRDQKYKVLAVHDAVRDAAGNVTQAVEVDLELIP